MPEIMKNEDGTNNWSAIFMGLAVALVLVMQQYQTMQIAKIETEAKIAEKNFMDKDKIVQIEKDIQERISGLEADTLEKDIIMNEFKQIVHRVEALEDKLNKK